MFYLLIQEDFPHSAIGIHGSGRYFFALRPYRVRSRDSPIHRGPTTPKLDESPFRFVKRFIA